MFDWDRDYDDTVRARRIAPLAEASTSERPERAETALDLHDSSRARTRPVPLVMVLLALITVGAGAASLFPGLGLAGLGGTTTHGAVSGAMIGLTAQLPESQPLETTPRVQSQPQPLPLPVMQVYDQRQIDAFRRGIARYSDAELQGWSAQLAQERDLTRPLRFPAHHSDLLALTRHEMARRGLPAAR